MRFGASAADDEGRTRSVLADPRPAPEPGRVPLDRDPGGLVRFDGEHAHVIERRAAPTMTTNHVQSVYRSRGAGVDVTRPSKLPAAQPQPELYAPCFTELGRHRLVGMIRYPGGAHAAREDDP